MSELLPWYEEKELMLQALPRPKKYESNQKKKPGRDDVDETEEWVKKGAPQVIRFITILFALSGALGAGLGYFLREKAFFSIYVEIGLYFILFLTMIAFAISSFPSLQSTLLEGKKENPKYVFLNAIKLWPKVTVATFLNAILLILSAPLIFGPPLLNLIFARMPYEVARGASFTEAFTHSYHAAFKQEGNAGIANVVLHTGVNVGFVILFYSLVGPMIPWEGVSLLIALEIIAYILADIYTRLFAFSIIGDAFFNGAIPEERVAKIRRNIPPQNIFRHTLSSLSRLLPALFLSFYVATLLADHFMDFPPSETEIQAVKVWRFENIDGTVQRSKDYVGKPIVFYAWAPWCTPCKFQVPHMKKLNAEKGDKYEVMAVAFSYKSRQSILDYVKDKDIHYPVYFGTNAINESFGISAFPTVMIIQDGKIIKRWSGITSGFQIKAAIPTLNE